jgi:hypothetical protein
MLQAGFLTSHGKPVDEFGYQKDILPTAITKINTVKPCEKPHDGHGEVEYQPDREAPKYTYFKYFCIHLISTLVKPIS